MIYCHEHSVANYLLLLFDFIVVQEHGLYFSALGQVFSTFFAHDSLKLSHVYLSLLIVGYCLSVNISYEQLNQRGNSSSQIV